jgi:hypothetical protein
MFFCPFPISKGREGTIKLVDLKGLRLLISRLIAALNRITIKKVQTMFKPAQKEKASTSL